MLKLSETNQTSLSSDRRTANALGDRICTAMKKRGWDVYYEIKDGELIFTSSAPNPSGDGYGKRLEGRISLEDASDIMTMVKNLEKQFYSYFETANSSRQLNSSVADNFGDWSVDQIRNTISALKSKASAFDCNLRITSTEIRLANRNDDSFSAVFDDDYGIELIEFNMGGSAIRGSLDEVDEITSKAFAKMDALNALKQVWKEVSQWLELLAYAKKSGLNSARRNLNSGDLDPESDYPVDSSRRKLNSSLQYDYGGEETEDGYFEGSVAGICSGLSKKYDALDNYQFQKDVAAYLSTAGEITFASQHDDNFEVDITASDEDEFEDTISEVVEFIKMQQNG